MGLATAQNVSVEVREADHGRPARLPLPPPRNESWPHGPYVLREPSVRPIHARLPVRTLLVRSSETGLWDAAAAAEDLGVMSRILEDALQRELAKTQQSWQAGGTYPGLIGRPEPQGVYLEGYGALFLLRVDFHLAPRPAAETGELEPDTDSLWIRTKQEMRGPPQTDSTEVYIPLRRRARYDPRRVERVEAAILQALKQATNIRALKPDDSVAVAVLGGGAPTALEARAVVESPTARGRGTRSWGTARAYSTTTAARQPTALTIHVTKAAVDAYAEGKLDSAGFREKATITAY